MGQLNAWTKIGDQATVTGRWVIYQDRARILSEVEKIADWGPEDIEVASRAYAARESKLTRGGLWLVAPDGKVVARTWIPARRNLF